jgi:hypothetical protein
VNPVHGSTVDRTEGVRPALIRAVRGRSHDPDCVRAMRGGGHTGTGRGRWRAAALRQRSLEKEFPTAKMSTGECYT